MRMIWGFTSRYCRTAFFWTDEMIKETANYIDEIQVSIDGFDEASNARIRGAGTFERSLHTIEKFVQEKNPSSVSSQRLSMVSVNCTRISTSPLVRR